MLNMPEWQALSNSAVLLKLKGDFRGAIVEQKKSIALTKGVPNLANQTILSLNYLADLCLLANDLAQAEESIREAIQWSRSCKNLHLEANLFILSEVLRQKGAHGEALVAAEEALALYRQQNNTYGVREMEEKIATIKEDIP
jgi:tetratricopeptide (TPR) repeat protein